MINLKLTKLKGLTKYDRRLKGLWRIIFHPRKKGCLGVRDIRVVVFILAKWG